MTPLRVGIVGAGGQVGSHLLAHLGGDVRFRVLGVCRNELTAGPLRMAGYDVYCGLVTERGAARDLLAECEVVVNCAAASGSPAKAHAQDEAVIRALCVLPGPKRLIQFSSVAVYGTCIDPRRNTFRSPRPDYPYGRDKLQLERVLRRSLRPADHECVVLRMGHVYGARQWLSRSILDMLEDPGRRLAFDGRLPSNAVHVRNVAAAIRTLILEWAKPGTYNLFDAPACTWREVFDWHTRAVGAAPIPALGDGESERCAARHRGYAATPLSLRLSGELVRWLRSLPASFVADCPTVKNLGAWGLTALRLERLEPRVQMRYAELVAAGSNHEDLPVPEPWLLSDGAPGPQLPYAGEVGAPEARALATWRARYSSPDAILSWDEPGPEGTEGRLARESLVADEGAHASEVA